MEECMEDTDEFFTAIDHICAQHNQRRNGTCPGQQESWMQGAARVLGTALPAADQQCWIAAGIPGSMQVPLQQAPPPYSSKPHVTNGHNSLLTSAVATSTSVTSPSAHHHTQSSAWPAQQCLLPWHAQQPCQQPAQQPQMQQAIQHKQAMLTPPPPWHGHQEHQLQQHVQPPAAQQQRSYAQLRPQQLQHTRLGVASATNPLQELPLPKAQQLLQRQPPPLPPQQAACMQVPGKQPHIHMPAFQCSQEQQPMQGPCSIPHQTALSSTQFAPPAAAASTGPGLQSARTSCQVQQPAVQQQKLLVACPQPQQAAVLQQQPQLQGQDQLCDARVPEPQLLQVLPQQPPRQPVRQQQQHGQGQQQQAQQQQPCSHQQGPGHVRTAADTTAHAVTVVDQAPKRTSSSSLAPVQQAQVQQVQNGSTNQAKRPRLTTGADLKDTAEAVSIAVSKVGLPAAQPRRGNAAVQPVSSRGFATTCGDVSMPVAAPLRPHQFYGERVNLQQGIGQPVPCAHAPIKQQQQQPATSFQLQPASARSTHVVSNLDNQGQPLLVAEGAAGGGEKQNRSEHAGSGTSQAIASGTGISAPQPHSGPSHPPPSSPKPALLPVKQQVDGSCQGGSSLACSADAASRGAAAQEKGSGAGKRQAAGSVLTEPHAAVSHPPAFPVVAAMPAAPSANVHPSNVSATAHAAVQLAHAGQLKAARSGQQQPVEVPNDTKKVGNRFAAFTCNPGSGHKASASKQGTTGAGPDSGFRGAAVSAAHNARSGHRSGQPQNDDNSGASNSDLRDIKHAHSSGSAAAAAERTSSSARGPPINVDITPSVESSTHILLKANHLLPDMDQLLRSVQGSTFDAARKLWSVPCRRFQHTREQLQNLPGCRIKWVQDLPPIVQAVYRASGCLHDDSSRYNILHSTMDLQGQSLDTRMMQFQREGVQFALRHGGRVLIGDEMGLGKTVQGCALLRCYQDDWPALVVAPSSLRQQWADALKQWIGVLDIDVHVVFSKADSNKVEQAFKQRAAHKGKGPPPPLLFRLLVISYEYLDKMKETLQGLSFKCVLLDEAHMIKNFKAKRSQASVPLLQQARRAILLTGTPALSSPVELLPLLQAALPQAKIRPDDFADRYCAGNCFSKFKGCRNKEELHLLLSGTFMIRRRKAEVLTQLPPKTRQQIYLCLDDKASSALSKQQEQLTHIKQLLGAVNPHNTGGLLTGLQHEQQQAIMRLYHHTAGLKIPAVQQYIKDMLEGDTKFLVFAHHHDLLDGLEKQVNACKKKYIRIDGKTDGRIRDKLRAQFQEDNETQVAILAITAAGVGLTLTAASTVVFAELSWVPGEILQAEDRVHRIGQESNVTIQFLLVRKSIDDIMWETLQSKLSTIGKVLDGKQESLQVVSRVTVGGAAGTGKLDAYLQPINRSDASHVADRPQNQAQPVQDTLSLQTAARVIAEQGSDSNASAQAGAHTTKAHGARTAHEPHGPCAHGTGGGNVGGPGSTKPHAAAGPGAGKQQKLDACFSKKAGTQARPPAHSYGNAAGASFKRIRDWGDDDDGDDSDDNDVALRDVIMRKRTDRRERA